ncbi:unnamed protein product [Schistosoma mattheei]|uniref:C3H1-type domain-containing protein n=1 Tax=Schistosoma mattheei TaxID=31246 RepID=A0AA85BDY4_9TREM|nr:unnamed protein product [Schistosoma mattheei]
MKYRINEFDRKMNLTLNILMIMMMIRNNDSTLIKHKTLINKIDGSNMEIVCILDHDNYCTEHHVGFLFHDGCRKCMCKIDGAYCTSKGCMYYQLTETNPEDYCRKLVEMNENGTSTLSENNRNESSINYNMTYIHKPGNETDDEANNNNNNEDEKEENNQNRKINKLINISEETNENVTISPLPTEENVFTDNDTEKMNFRQIVNNTPKLNEEVEEQLSSVDIHRHNKTINESLQVTIKNIENNSVSLPITKNNVTVKKDNPSLNVDKAIHHKVANQTHKLPILTKDQRQIQNDTNSSLFEDEHYSADYDNEIELERNNTSLPIKNENDSISTKKSNNDDSTKKEIKLPLVDETMQNDETSNQSDEEIIIKNINPVMNQLSETLNSENPDSFITPAEKIVNKDLINVVMDNKNVTNNHSNHAQDRNAETNEKHQNVKQNVAAEKDIIQNKEKENNNINESSSNKQPVNTTDAKQLHHNVSTINKEKHKQQSNASTQDDSNNWVSREITVSSRTVKLPNEKSMKNMHEMFPHGGLPFLEVEEKDTQSYDDTIHGKHSPSKSPLKSVSFTTNNHHNDQLIGRLEELLRMITDIKHYLEMLKPCLPQPQPRHPMIKMPFQSKLPPKHKLLAF